MGLRSSQLFSRHLSKPSRPVESRDASFKLCTSRARRPCASAPVQSILVPAFPQPPRRVKTVNMSNAFSSKRSTGWARPQITSRICYKFNSFFTNVTSYQLLTAAPLALPFPPILPKTMNSAAMLLAFLECLMIMVTTFAAAGNGRFDFDPLDKLLWERRLGGRRDASASLWGESIESYSPAPPVYMGRQDGLMVEDRIVELPGEPAGVNFNHYAGYVTVEPNNGRALFYYFAESPLHAATKPLLLWLNGGNYQWNYYLFCHLANY
ncbi:hypothetical protein ACLOJK_013630 [Asimina triloba]